MTRNAPAPRRTSTSSTQRPLLTRPRTSFTASAAKYSYHLTATNQPRVIRSWSGSSTRSTSRKSRRRSPRRLVLKDLPLEYATAVCNLYLQLGARGVSVIFASGDDGVGRGDCKPKDGSGKIQFSLVFPAPCTCVISSHLGSGTVHQRRYKFAHHLHYFTGPCVISVGGNTKHDPEIAAKRGLLLVPLSAPVLPERCCSRLH